MSADRTDPPAGDTAGAITHPAHRALSASLTKLEALLERATATSPERAALDDRAIASEKGRILLELSRIELPAAGQPTPQALVERVKHVRDRLLDEQRFLKRRIEAAEVISGVIADAVLAADWDGTYEPRGALTAPGPARTKELQPTGASTAPRLRPQAKAGAKS